MSFGNVGKTFFNTKDTKTNWITAGWNPVAGHELLRKTFWAPLKDSMNPDIPEVSMPVDTTKTDDAAAAAAAEAEAARLRRRKGRKATIITGDLGSGDISPNKLEKATAMG